MQREGSESCITSTQWLVGRLERENAQVPENFNEPGGCAKAGLQILWPDFVLWLPKIMMRDGYFMPIKLH